MDFVHLHLHSQYSILDSTLSIQDILDKVKSDGASSVALTDFCNMFGSLDFYNASLNDGIKPIIGCEIMVAPNNHLEKKKIGSQPVGYPLILLAKNRDGYRNLCKLSSIAYTEGFYYYPRIDKELIEHHHQGLICLTGPFYGKIGSLITSNDDVGLFKEIDWMVKIFNDDLYLEVSRHKMSDENLRLDGVDKEPWLLQKIVDAYDKQEKIILKLKELGREKGIKCVATNDVKYLCREDWVSHEILMNVGSGESCEILDRDTYGKIKGRTPNPKRNTTYSHELYLKSPNQMRELFADFPEAIANTAEVAKKINLEFDFNKKFYPVYIPPGLDDKKDDDKQRLELVATYLKKICYEGIERKYTKNALDYVKEKFEDRDPLDVVKERLEYELSVIIPTGLCDYLLIVHDFIAWAKSQEILVGPGRGSGVGSIILYLIGITDIEPLRFNLFFERFINPERLSYPDIDVDICMERRSEVIDYTIKKYGKDKVAQIITFGTMKAKMAIKDVGRVLSVPLSKVNLIAKLIPDDIGMTIKRAFEIDEDLKKIYEEDEESRRVLDVAQKLEGSIRNTGVHAAGIIICGDPLTDHIPVCLSKESDMVVTQFSMKPVELAGMLKIDFLGLKTLTSIQKAISSIKTNKGDSINWVNLDLRDKKTFDLINQGKTEGIFQLESAGMTDLARQLHIDKFEEIIAVGALYRPGPMDMIPSFIARKHGKEEIIYDHKCIESILQETYGVMVYQEQVMAIASTLAGYSLGEGDVLRRAMGKKDRAVMAKERKKFRDGAVANGIDDDVAIAIFDKIEKFASYGFNKSHSTAYGYISYVTAYLKANYTNEWMAALMTCDLHDISKVAKHIRGCQSIGIAVLPPDVNESHGYFVATDIGIRFALTAIKGIGEGVINSIVNERGKNGSFISFPSFLKRVDTSTVGKKMIENLIKCGSFDFTSWTRGQLITYLLKNFDFVVKKKKEELQGIMDFFDLFKNESECDLPPTHVNGDFNKLETLKNEKELLGFYVTGHPLDEFSSIVEKLQCTPLDQLESLKINTIVKAAFVIDKITIKVSARSGKKFAILVVSNGFEKFDLPVWPELYEQSSEILEDNAIVIGVLHIDKEDDVLKLSCKWICKLTTMDESLSNKLEDIYVREKNRVLKDSSKNNLHNNKNKAVVNMMKLTVDIDQIKMSWILLLKKIFQDHMGPNSVEINFTSKNALVGSVVINSEVGVKISDELVERLKEISCVVTITN